MESKDIYAKLMVLYNNLLTENKKMEDHISDINLKLEQIHSVLGFILEKTNLVKTAEDDLIQLKDLNGSVLDLQ
jgi:hypothetical protein